MCHAMTHQLRRIAGSHVYLKTLGLSVLCLLFFASVAAMGQSGRKPKQTDPPPSVQIVNQSKTATPEPAATPEKPKEKGPAILVMTPFPPQNLQLNFLVVAGRACLQEMRKVPGLEVSEARDQWRTDAIKAAKEDDHRVVVYLEFSFNAFRAGQPREEDMTLHFTIFEPKTGKVMTTGAGYPVRPPYQVPNPSIGVTREEWLVELAGQDAARKILKKLNLKGHPLLS